MAATGERDGRRAELSAAGSVGAVMPGAPGWSKGVSTQLDSPARFESSRQSDVSSWCPLDAELSFISVESLPSTCGKLLGPAIAAFEGVFSSLSTNSANSLAITSALSSAADPKFCSESLEGPKRRLGTAAVPTWREVEDCIGEVRG